MTTTRATLEWSEFVAWAEKPATNSDRRNHSASFAGCTYPEALKMAKGEGYMEALPDAQTLASAVEDTIATDLFQTTFTATYEVAGAEVDMGRFLSGEPECMIESQPLRISRAGRAVRIGVPICCSGSVPNVTIQRRGAAVMALCDLLARAQHPVEVWAVIANGTGGKDSRTRGDRTCMMIKVQAANEPLDPGRLMYALAHPSALRQLGFTAQEQYPEEVRSRFGFRPGGGYGKPAYGLLEEDFDATDGTSIILPPLEVGSRHSWSEEDALAWIREQIDRIFS